MQNSYFIFATKSIANKKNAKKIKAGALLLLHYYLLKSFTYQVLPSMILRVIKLLFYIQMDNKNATRSFFKCQKLITDDNPSLGCSSNIG